MKERIKLFFTRIEKRPDFEKIVASTLKDVYNMHPHYSIKQHEAMSVIKRFVGTYYTHLNNNGELENLTTTE